MVSQSILTNNADLVVYGERVHPFDGEDENYRGMAVRENRIVALARSWEDLEPWIGPRTNIIREGLVFTPAFADSHNHVMTALRDLFEIPLETCANITDMRDTLRIAATSKPHGDWLVSTRQWTADQLEERRLPTRSELDEVSPHHPVCLRVGAHSMFLNSRALATVGIDRNTPNPRAGTIVRDEHGDPTGELREYPAFEAVLTHLPEPTFEQLVDGLQTILRRYNAAGIGSVRNAGVRKDELLIYQALRRAEELTVRNNVLVRIDPVLSEEAKADYIRSWQLTAGLGDDLLNIAGLKFFIDGAGESSAIYRDSNISGHLFVDADEFSRLLELSFSRGWRVACHAVGDAAVDVALDGLERCTSRPSEAGSLVLEHAWLTDARQRQRARKLGVWVSTQYAHYFIEAAGSLTRHWGANRVARGIPLRSWLSEGVTVALGSDWNVTPGATTQPFDPMLSIWGATTRRVLGDETCGAAEAITAREAFELHTVNGAMVANCSTRRGSIRPGNLADFIAFRRDPLDCEPDELRNLRPVLTVVDGRVVYEAPARRGA
jgi:predicted amidohydrolase YtcJ